MARLALVIAAILALVACAGSQPAPVTSPPAGAPDESAASGQPAAATGEASGTSGEVGAEGDPSTAAGEVAVAGGGQGQQGKVHEFKKNRTGTPGLSHGVKKSAVKPTRTEAALKFTVVDKKKGPIKGIVIKLTGPAGKTFYTEETDAKGYTEVLVPVGKTYEVVYLSLGRKKIAAKLPVENKPALTIRLTLRYKRYEAPSKRKGLVLEGVQFDSGKAKLRPSSYGKLDRVVEYMQYKRSARIEISGHTDNVGNARRNKALSKRRAQACRKYLISKGIDASRIQAVGYGSERPIASNDTAMGRQANRRIEAQEL